MKKDTLREKLADLYDEAGQYFGEENITRQTFEKLPDEVDYKTWVEDYVEVLYKEDEYLYPHLLNLFEE